MKDVIHRVHYDARWDMVIHTFRCLRTGIDVYIRGNGRTYDESCELARRMLLKGRFQIAIQKELK